MTTYGLGKGNASSNPQEPSQAIRQYFQHN